MKLVSTKPLLINVVGKPAPQGSKISTRFGMREASQFVAPWRNQVVSACIEQRINEGEVITEPVKVEISFTFFRPKSHYGTGKNAEIYIQNNKDVWWDNEKLFFAIVIVMNHLHLHFYSCFPPPIHHVCNLSQGFAKK